MSDVACIADTESLLSFFNRYSKTIISIIDCLPSNYSRHQMELVKYLDIGLHKDLHFATHLDINDLVIALKKGIFTEFAELAEKMYNELVVEDEFIFFLKLRLKRYEWVSKLTSKQREINQYLERGKGGFLSDSENKGLANLIGIDSLPKEYVTPTLKLLEYYGHIQLNKIDKAKYTIISIKGASLSLKDIHKNVTTSEFKEVRFLCTECFYIDTSLHRKSMNVVVVASKIVVRKELGEKKIEINVCGGKGKSYDTCPAIDGKPSSDDGIGADGKNGRDGEPGESGGNILVCADTIENSEHLTLRSVGGDGGGGQDGGNGQDGKAKPSYSDDLSRFGGYKDLFIFRRVSAYFNNRTFHDHYHHVETLKNYAYGISSEGVKLLHGVCRHGGYGFIYSGSKWY